MRAPVVDLGCPIESPGEACSTCLFAPVVFLVFVVLQKHHPLLRCLLGNSFVSPFGHECINNGSTDNNTYGSVANIRTYAIKRVIADEYLAKGTIESP